ncbi:hypothetical protein AVEN_5547-1 [Araneus ventricosus]|uniref:Uncharacterized protein n=1 Tax=Araneus ventricosus TaxID=182803 RepID=A0A4Y2DUC7_ARAVE|nr:hypothetical protein AVEN_5547-1 [Araneus ventricosus]
MSKSSEEFHPSLIPKQNSNCLNLDIRKFEWSIKNELMQKMRTESTYCESDTDENNNSNRRIDRILLDSRSSSEDEYLESDDQKDIKCDKNIENCKTLVCKFDNKVDLARNLAGNDRLPTWVKCFEIEAVEEEDTEKYEKVLNPIFRSDDHLPALDSGKERRDCSKSLTKVKKFGVNPFQIGILINKSDFLEHCRMVKNGSLKQCIENSGTSNHIEKERLEQYSKDLELTADEETYVDIVTSPATETKSGHTINEHERTSHVKFSSHENFTRKASDDDNQKTIDLSHSKSVSDLIQHFESNCGGNTHKKRDCSRSIKRNKKTNYSEINRNAETETEIQTQYKRDRLENDLLSCSMQKVNDSFVYNMSDRSKEESSVVRIVQQKDLPDSSVDNFSEFFALLEMFWFLVVMIVIFWHLIVI